MKATKGVNAAPVAMPVSMDRGTPLSRDGGLGGNFYASLTSRWNEGSGGGASPSSRSRDLVFALGLT